MAFVLLSELIRLVSQGSIKEALELTMQGFPRIFEDSKEIVFRLKCQQFIEHIKAGLCECPLIEAQKHFQTTIDFGASLQQEFVDLDSDPVKFRKQLEEIFSLLAYRNPYHSPISYLLNDVQRKSIASALNDAILATYFKSKIFHSSLDRISAQIQLLLKELATSANDPSVALVSFQTDVYFAPIE
jgi:hypothetical protein